MSPVLKTFSDFACVGTDIKINELRDYLNTLRKQIESMAEDYEKEVESQAQKIEDERERDDFYEWSSQDYWNYKETFPRILFNSFLISAYTLLEAEIYSIARRLGKKQQQLFDVSDLGGRNYLETASVYINRLTGINIKDFNSWQLVVEGRTLRNNIVHSNGVLTKDKEIEIARRYDLIKETNIEIESGRSIKHLSVTYEYNKSFISTLKEFFIQIYKGMNDGDYL